MQLLGPARKSSFLLQFAFVTDVNDPLQLLSSWAWGSGRLMSTNVAPKSVFLGAFLRFSDQFIAVSDGYLEDGFRAVYSVCADLLHLQVFFGREKWLFDSNTSIVQGSGPGGGACRFRDPLQAPS